MIPQKNPLIASGESVHANMFVKLWENPNPTASFDPQPIPLSSDDYDFLLWIIKYSDSYQYSVVTAKGATALFRTTGATGSSYTTTNQRTGNFVSNTSYSITQNYTQNSNSARSTDNTVNFPLFVYGFKKSLDITAIVSNVSTDATKCILSDNVTNVDDAVKYKLVTLTGALTSVAANSYATISLSGSIPSGYTPISIIKFEAGNTGLDVELVSTSAMRVYNNTGSAKNAAPEAIVACVKSSIVS